MNYVNNTEEDVPTEASFHGFPNLEDKIEEAEKRLPGEDEQFKKGHGHDANVSEIENVELQIKQLEKELDNTVDNVEGEEEYERIQDVENVDVSVREQLSNEYNEDQYIDGKDTMTDGDDPDYRENFTINQSKSLLVDNYMNNIVEKDMISGKSPQATTQDSTVSEDMERIFGAGVEEFNEKLRNNQLLSNMKGSKQLSVLNNPPDKLANLVGSNTISIERTNLEQIKRKPDSGIDYSSLRIERVSAKSREIARPSDQIKNQPVRIEKVGSADRARPIPTYEAWVASKGQLPNHNEEYNSGLIEDYTEMELSESQDDHRNVGINYGTDNMLPKRFRSNSPAIGSNHLPFDKAENLEMSIVKRSKKVKNELKASNLDLQINKLKQSYSSGPHTEPMPIMENEYMANNPTENLSRLSIPELLEVSKAAVNLSRKPSQMESSFIPPAASVSKSQLALNHSCVICNKNDFAGSNDNNKLTAIKAHYCNHFMAEILDLHKNEIMGNVCMVDRCNMTIVDKGEKKRNLARHIGTKHNKIYKIMKLRGHKIDFLKHREEKQKPKDLNFTERNPEIDAVGHQTSILNPVQERKPAMPPIAVIEKKAPKSGEKIECNFCKRKYSTTFNLRKHILSVHDKILE